MTGQSEVAVLKTHVIKERKTAAYKNLNSVTLYNKEITALLIFA
jgi:hypothetical protein